MIQISSTHVTLSCAGSDSSNIHTPHHISTTNTSVSSLSRNLLDTPSELFTDSDEKTPVPSPKQSNIYEERPFESHDAIEPVDIFVKHTSVEERHLKATLTRTISAGRENEIRPSLLARAQLFFQKQLEGLTSSVSTTSSVPALPANNTDVISNEIESSSNNESLCSIESHLQQTDVTDTENQSHLSSIETDSSTESTATVRNVRRTNSLPHVNARHLTPDKFLKKEIQNRDKSPYRLMPDLQRRPSYLSPVSPASSQGIKL